MISKDEIIKLIEEAEETPTLDYKEELHLETDGDKAEFVKDVIALANSGELAHIIVGVEDGTGKPVGCKTAHTIEQLNQILRDKCDPPISVEYIEKNILSYKIGIIEFKGENPPYIVSVPDKFGGQLSSNPQKSFFIHRGTIFIRNYNINEGVRRADVDKIYGRKQYVALQVDVQLSNEVEVKSADKSQAVKVKLFLVNVGEVIATNTIVWMQFKNVKKIIKCEDPCRDMSAVNDDIPTVGIKPSAPIVRPIRHHCGSVTVEVEKGVQQIETEVIIGAQNMRTKEGPYSITIKKEGANRNRES